MFDPRLRAILDLSVPRARLDAGRHEYDGTVQDLSPEGVHAGLRRLPTTPYADQPASSPYADQPDATPASTPEQPLSVARGGYAYADPHDEAHASATEHALRVMLGELELHRVNPMLHIENLELDCYDRDYAPAEERAAALKSHLERWPDAVDAAVRSLDRMPVEVAMAVLPAARGLAAYIDDAAPAIEATTHGSPPITQEARAALDRFVNHLETAGRPDAPLLGEAGLAKLLGSSEAIDVDLGKLAARADSERDRLRELLAESCARLAPDQSIAQTLDRLDDDHPTAENLVDHTRELVGTVLDWTAQSGLVPVDDGECLVGTTPPSQPWQVATMTTAAPYEPDAPSWFRVTPPPPGTPAAKRDAWLRTYSRPQLANIAIHEVAPGHFSHGRALRRLSSDVRRSLHSSAFSEGWAHCCEELALEQGFGDDAFAAAVARDGLLRVTRLACSIGLHTGEMTLGQAAERMTTDAFVHPAMARQRAARGLFDPTMGKYTWGKLVILDLREQAQKTWGAEFSLARFHRALLDLGSPPLGLLPTAIERG